MAESPHPFYSLSSSFNKPPLVLHSSKGVDKPTAELAMGSGRPSPDPGLGTAVELTGGEVSGGLNLRMIREALAGEGIPPEEAPPAFDEVQPAGAGGNGVLMDTGMGGEPLPDGTTGVAGQVVVDEVEVTDLATSQLNRRAKPWVWGRPPRPHRQLRRHFVYSL